MDNIVVIGGEVDDDSVDCVRSFLVQSYGSVLVKDCADRYVIVSVTG